jgi:hypothetical protein
MRSRWLLTFALGSCTAAPVGVTSVTAPASESRPAVSAANEPLIQCSDGRFETLAAAAAAPVVFVGDSRLIWRWDFRDPSSPTHRSTDIHPADLAVDPSGRWLAVSDRGDEVTVQVVDWDSGDQALSLRKPHCQVPGETSDWRAQVTLGGSGQPGDTWLGVGYEFMMPNDSFRFGCVCAHEFGGAQVGEVTRWSAAQSLATCHVVPLLSRDATKVAWRSSSFGHALVVSRPTEPKPEHSERCARLDEHDTDHNSEGHLEFVERYWPWLDMHAVTDDGTLACFGLPGTQQAEFRVYFADGDDVPDATLPVAETADQVFATGELWGTPETPWLLTHEHGAMELIEARQNGLQSRGLVSVTNSPLAAVAPVAGRPGVIALLDHGVFALVRMDGERIELDACVTGKLRLRWRSGPSKVECFQITAHPEGSPEQLGATLQQFFAGARCQDVQ